MGNKCGYFQLKNGFDGTYLVLYPGEDGSAPLFSDADEYLKSLHIEYDKISLMKEIANFNAAKQVRLNTTVRSSAEREMLFVYISSDRKKAFGKFFPPSAGGELLSGDDIISDMVHAGVKYGVVQQNIDSFLSDRQYCKEYVLAEALLPVEGSGAEITYHFNTSLSQKPKLNPDGTVDFHQLDNISAIQAGDCLATLKPAVFGKPGIDVTGKAIAPLKVQVKRLKSGRNLELSEDGLKMYSKVSGHATLIDGTVFVSDTFEVKDNVDTSTGDIEYDGNVLIHGNVLTGFSVHAKGDVMVDGVVEGAEIVAGGQIVLKCGIQGMGRGKLVAGGNIISKFIENAEVNSGGFITTEAILHSKVTAKGEIEVNGRKGFVTGGEIRSGSGVSVNTAGSTMGTTTVIEIGTDPALMEEYHQIDKSIPALEKECEKCEQILALFLKKIKAGDKLDAEKMLQMKTAKETREQLQMKIQESLERMEQLKAEAGADSEGCLRVKGVIYPGCKVILYNVTYYVRSEMKYCRLIKSQADVKMVEY